MPRSSTVLARARRAVGPELSLDVLLGSRPVTCRCGICSFSVVAPLEEAREAFAEHVCGRPQAVVSVRQR